jgi:hypothetical protein
MKEGLMMRTTDAVSRRSTVILNFKRVEGQDMTDARVCLLCRTPLPEGFRPLAVIRAIDPQTLQYLHVPAVGAGTMVCRGHTRSTGWYVYDCRFPISIPHAAQPCRARLSLDLFLMSHNADGFEVPYSRRPRVWMSTEFQLSASCKSVQV